MAKSVKPKPDDPAQSQRFAEAAKELEVDESGRSFAHAFKKIVQKATRRVKRSSKVGA